MFITEPLPTDRRARLVFGLNWSAYPVKGVRAERRRYADDYGATHYVEMKVAGEMLGGFAAPDAADLRRTRLFSGAARIALLERVKSRPAVLALLQNAHQVFLVHVVRGAVRNDEVLSPEAAKARRIEIEQQCLRQNLPLVTFGSGALVGDVDEALGAGELLKQKSGRISKLPVSVPPLIPVAVIVIALAVFGGKLFDIVSPPPPPPPAPPSWQEQYDAAVRAVFASKPPVASILAPKLLDTFGDVETNVSGWQFDHADCAATGTCSVTYRRAGGSFDGFERTAPPTMRPLAFGRDGLSLTTRGPAVPKVPAIALARSKQWLNEQQLIETLQTPPQRLSVKALDLDSHGYTVRLDPPARVLSAPPAPGDRHGRLVLQGNWEIDGFRWQAPLLAALPENMALDSITVSLLAQGAAGIHFAAKGKYYVLD
ncbi:hypothetical protein [Paraburkholderia megapolitana]|uniref:hypothetical protein n=1 Tax=Paraburkholderia megapolitana TaxID=420953 RepID=UPI0038B78932